MGKKGKILVKTFYWWTHYLFGNILFWTLGQIIRAPQTVLPSYGYGTAIDWMQLT